MAISALGPNAKALAAVSYFLASCLPRSTRRVLFARLVQSTYSTKARLKLVSLKIVVDQTSKGFELWQKWVKYQHERSILSDAGRNRAARSKEKLLRCQAWLMGFVAILHWAGTTNSWVVGHGLISPNMVAQSWGRLALNWKGNYYRRIESCFRYFVIFSLGNLAPSRATSHSAAHKLGWHLRPL